MGDLDVAAKILLRLEPEALLGLGLPHLRVQSAVADEVELPVMSRRMDKFLRVEVEGESEPYLVNIEAVANWASDVPKQAFEYWSLARLAVRHDRIATLAVVFKPGERQGEPRNYFSAEALGTRNDFVYGLVCLWTRTAEELLAGPPGLIPLLPFTADASIERIDEAIATLHHAPPSHRAELLGALAVCAANVYPEIRWFARLPKEIVMENTFIRELEARGETRGKQLGEVSGRLAIVTMVLAKKVDAARAQGLHGRLARCPAELLEDVTALLLREDDQTLIVRELDRLLPEGGS